MDSFVQLSRLLHLTELKLCFVDLDLATLELAHPMPIIGVRKLDLSAIHYNDTNPSIDTICRIISSIFPSVENFSLSFFVSVRIIRLH